MSAPLDTSAAAVRLARRLLTHPEGVWRAHAEEAADLIDALAAERDAALAEVARLKAMPPRPVMQGCVCPGDAPANCHSIICPRKPPVRRGVVLDASVEPRR